MGEDGRRKRSRISRRSIRDGGGGIMSKRSSRIRKRMKRSYHVKCRTCRSIIAIVKEGTIKPRILSGLLHCLNIGVGEDAVPTSVKKMCIRDRC